ncbi:replication protein A 32 kDa subunit-like isoform X2 [Lineus longissimus]
MKRARATKVTPSTIADILSCTADGNSFTVMGGQVELNQVSIIGIVKSVKDGPSRIDYEIDDLTGGILEVKQFVDNEDTPEHLRIKPQRENAYVKIFGHMRRFQDKQTVVAFKTAPLSNLNELTTHILETIHTRLVLSNGKNVTQGTATSGKVNTIPIGNADENRFDGSDGLNGLTPIQQQVQLKIASTISDQGISVQTICEQLRGVTEAQIRKAIDFLSSEGHIYSTVDDDHYKTTDS